MIMRRGDTFKFLDAIHLHSSDSDDTVVCIVFRISNQVDVNLKTNMFCHLLTGIENVNPKHLKTFILLLTPRHSFSISTQPSHSFLTYRLTQDGLVKCHT